MTTPEEAVRGAVTMHQKCATCGIGDALFVQVECPDGYPGCLTWHGMPVPCAVCAFVESKLTAERSRLAARVEGMRRDVDLSADPDEQRLTATFSLNPSGSWVSYADLLALLREGA